MLRCNRTVAVNVSRLDILQVPRIRVQLYQRLMKNMYPLAYKRKYVQITETKSSMRRPTQQASVFRAKDYMPQS
jgi:hypothetical protein